MSSLTFATCSWKYDSWREIIYSDKPDINYLKEYSKHYASVEVDQWFWSLFDNKVDLPQKIYNLLFHMLNKFPTFSKT